MLPLKEPKHDREGLFISRYEALREWALKLTERSVSEAEDLLHDTFIYFTRSQTRVEDIRNLDGYLYTMLRNLRLSQARRFARTPLGNLSLIDYDSAEDGLNFVDPRDRIKAQDELRAICQYACLRKQTSKSGSVLILRFFHGYFPNEIAQILCSPRSAVDKLLQAARREAAVFKNDPEALTFLHTDKSKNQPEFKFGQLSTDILTEVREAILAGSGQECPKMEIDEIYQDYKTEKAVADRKPIEAVLAAHLVSCNLCLETVNDRLGLPSLASRLAAEDNTRDNGGSRKPPKSGGGSSSGGDFPTAQAFLLSSRKRAEQIFEHQPKELHISVNGFIVGSQRINSEMSELALSVNLDEKIGFIEVFSERDVRLLFQSIEPPPDGLPVQSTRMELSGERVLELKLNFAETWPLLYASYHDPSFAEVRSTGEVLSPSSIKSAGTNENSTAGELKGSINSGSGWKGLLGRILRRLFNLDFRLWLQPVRLTAVLGLLIISALVFWKLNIPPEPVSVIDLLNRATISERETASATDLIIHKTVNLEERDAVGNVISNRKIETWISGEQGLVVRRLYDEQGKLVAGEWKRRDGSRTLYSSKEKPKLGRHVQTVSPPDNVDEAWLIEASAENFRQLTTKNPASITDETAQTYTIAYEPAQASESNGNNPKLVNAKLVLSKDDLRTIEQILTVQGGEERREYRYVEASYQKVSPHSVAPSVFEPERELLADLLKNLKVKANDQQLNANEKDSAANLSNLANANTARNTNLSAPTATADLEVEALNLLNKAGADTGEQISVLRDRKGVLRIEGIVESENRKNELIQALASIANNPAVRINIMTVAEAVAKEESQKRPKNSQTEKLSAERVDTLGGEVPVRRQLIAYFGSEEAANNFATRMIVRSGNAMSRAGALKRLIGQFTLAEIKSLSPEAREKWLSLIRSHARVLQQETAALRQDLTPVFGGGTGGGSVSAIDDDAALIRSVNRLFELGAANDRTVRSTLSISSNSSAGTLSADFFRSLRTTEEIASRLQSVR